MNDIKEELKEKQAEHKQQLREVMKLQHQQLLEHPAMATVISAVRKHKESFINLLSSNVTNTSMSDAQFRGLAINIRNSDAVLALMTDSETLTKFLLPD